MRTGDVDKRPLALLLWMIAQCACGGNIDVECEGEGCESSSLAGCPSSVWDVHEDALCEISEDTQSCSYPDPDCPGATLIYSCQGVWKVADIEWVWPNCNSDMTCPEDPQSVGAACNVWPEVLCTYDIPDAPCGAAPAQLHCIEAKWACATGG
jgi:hypothetical protein